MFLNNLLRNFTFRLSLWYAFIFVLSTTVLLALVYYLVSSAFQHKDEEVLLAQLKEYATVYQAQGPEALRALGPKGSEWSQGPALGLLEAFLNPDDGRSHVIHLSPSGRELRDRLDAIIAESVTIAPQRVVRAA